MKINNEFILNNEFLKKFHMKGFSSMKTKNREQKGVWLIMNLI